MADVFREVDEEVKREQYLKLAKKYGSHMIVAAVAVVVVTGAIVGWRDYRTRTQEADGVRFEQAVDLIEKGDLDKAVAEFAGLASEGSAGYRVLAKLRQASAVHAKDPKESLALYDGVARDGAAPELLRALANVRAALTLLDVGEAKDVLARIETYTGETSPWRFLAREIKALAEMKAGNDVAAADTLKALIDDAKAPQGLRSRAAELLAALDVGK
ncbi:MAG: tetratricopeptide repeat protein [Alphaproteobacteria bacterium]|nr:tetratricopeptide repeat protein [Alphaproteobacteria bacterium]